MYASSRNRNRARSKRRGGGGGGGGGTVLLNEPFDDNSNGWTLNPTDKAVISGGKVSNSIVASSGLAESPVAMTGSNTIVADLASADFTGCVCDIIVFSGGALGVASSQHQHGYVVRFHWKTFDYGITFPGYPAVAIVRSDNYAQTAPFVEDLSALNGGQGLLGTEVLKVEAIDTGTKVTIRVFIDDVQIGSDYVDNSPPANRSTKNGLYLGASGAGTDVSVTSYVLSEL